MNSVLSKSLVTVKSANMFQCILYSLSVFRKYAKRVISLSLYCYTVHAQCTCDRPAQCPLLLQPTSADTDTESDNDITEFYL